jgi:hypothetical protein
MRRVGNDRSRFPSNPSETDRKIERLRDEDSVLETRAVVGGTFEVTGAIPEFTGVPAGLQQFYVAPIVVDDSINMSDTVQLEVSANGFGDPYNRPFAQDTGNTFLSGTAAVVGLRETGSVVSTSAAVYNYATPSVSSYTFGTSNRKYVKVGPQFSLAYSDSNPNVYVIQNGISTLVTLASSVVSNFVSCGVAADTSKIFSLWYNPTVNIVYAQINNLDGTVHTAAYIVVSGINTIPTDFHAIDNGWAAFYTSSGGVWRILRTTSSLQGYKEASISFDSTGSFTHNISTDGYMYFSKDSTDDLERLDLNTGLVSVYPEVFARYVDSPTKTHEIDTVCMYAISGTKLVFGGTYQSLVAPDTGTFYPIYSAVVIAGAGANVSDSIFTTYATVSGGATKVYAITGMTNGNVVYAVQTPAPYDDFLVKVTGP